MTARQVATIVGSVCPNCRREPCHCTVLAPVVPVAGDRPPRRRKAMRRYVMPGGAILNVDEESAAAATSAGAVLCEGE